MAACLTRRRRKSKLHVLVEFAVVVAVFVAEQSLARLQQ